MKKIELICVGDIKFKALKELEQDYLQKINFFSSFNVYSIKDVKSQDDTLKIKKEGELILELLDKKDFVIALDRKGKKMDSLEFSRFLADKISWHPSRIAFLIGGHAGLSRALDSRIDFKLSFSEMTFSHDIFRVLFLEQLYRAFTILKGIKYHR
jgi:23S rRNA (pseudouridine1915-N3)-methyltransferase